MPPKRPRHSVSTTAPSSSGTARPERKTRSKSLGGGSLAPPQEGVLSPGKLRRRSLVPKRSILKSTPSLTSVPQLPSTSEINANDDDDQTVAMGSLGFQGINTNFTQDLTRLGANHGAEDDETMAMGMGRKSLGANARRVSFAAKAHIRLFEIERLSNSPSNATSTSSEDATSSTLESNNSAISGAGDGSMDMSMANSTFAQGDQSTISQMSNESSFVSDAGPPRDDMDEGESSMEICNTIYSMGGGVEQTGDTMASAASGETTSSSVAEERELEALRNLRERRRSLTAFIDDGGEEDMSMTTALPRESLGRAQVGEGSLSMELDEDDAGVQEELVEKSERRRSGSFAESLAREESTMDMEMTNVHAAAIGEKALQEQSISFVSEDDSMDIDEENRTMNITQTLSKALTEPEEPKEEVKAILDPIPTPKMQIQDEVDKENAVTPSLLSSASRRPFGTFKPTRPSSASKSTPTYVPPPPLPFPSHIFQAKREEEEGEVGRRRRTSSPRRVVREVEEEEIRFSPHRVVPIPPEPAPVEVFTSIERERERGWRMSTIPEVTEVISEEPTSPEKSLRVGEESTRFLGDETGDMSRVEKSDAYAKLKEKIKRLSIGAALSTDLEGSQEPPLPPAVWDP
ncbi:hypothetical protein BT69DRAFT_650613 [Atractiella rhizophila]|nr:hypothetical protein BT69DRAFT_650613 [Atractiella rhizophila]